MKKFTKRFLILIALAAPIFAFAQRPVGELQAEYKMPIWRNVKAAELTIVVPENGPKTASVDIYAPDGTKIRTDKVRLKP